MYRRTSHGGKRLGLLIPTLSYTLLQFWYVPKWPQVRFLFEGSPWGRFRRVSWLRLGQTSTVRKIWTDGDQRCRDVFSRSRVKGDDEGYSLGADDVSLSLSYPFVLSIFSTHTHHHVSWLSLLTFPPSVLESRTETGNDHVLEHEIYLTKPGPLNHTFYHYRSG